MKDDSAAHHGGEAPPIVYNLFPRLAGPMDQWPSLCKRVVDMGFNWVYLNPLHYPGFSGSLYSVKEYYRINPAFLPQELQGEDVPYERQAARLRQTIAELHGMGLRVMMDLVINHTAIDSPLLEQHPQWFGRDENGDVVNPGAIDPADDRKVTRWGDLAEIDHWHSSERESLWGYWRELVSHSMDLGFNGFRCDAAYKVPGELWSHLIGGACAADPDCRFFAETLGCRLEEVEALASAGFHYFFNSSKWWNFSEAWALEQHHQYGAIAPSISFPESHDTDRLAAESGLREQVQRQRYAFAAALSKGVMIPMGFEAGYQRKLDVVNSSPADREATHMDLTKMVGRINRLKCALPIMGMEGSVDSVGGLEGRALVLARKGGSREGDAGSRATMLVIINKDWDRANRVTLPLAEGGLWTDGLATSTVDPVSGTAPGAGWWCELGDRVDLHRVCREAAPGETHRDAGLVETRGGASFHLDLQPAEVVYLFPSQ